MSKISFDFDGTLIGFDGADIESMHAKLKEHIAAGDEVIIVTKRNPGEVHNGTDASIYVKEKFGDIPVHYTNHQLKWQTLLSQNVNTHYDDDPNEIKAINDNIDIETILVQDDKSPEHEEYLQSHVNEAYINKLKFKGGRLQNIEEYFDGLNHELDMGHMNDINNMNRSMGADTDGNL